MARKQTRVKTKSKTIKSSKTNDELSEEVVSKHFIKKELKNEPDKVKDKFKDAIVKTEDSLVEHPKRRKTTKTLAKSVESKEDIVVSKHFIKADVLIEENIGDEGVEDFLDINRKRRKTSDEISNITSKLAAACKREYRKKGDKETSCSKTGQNSVKTRNNVTNGIKRKLAEKEEYSSDEDTWIKSGRGLVKTRTLKRKLLKKEENHSDEDVGSGLDSENTGMERRVSKIDLDCSIEVTDNVRKAANNENVNMKTEVIGSQARETGGGAQKKPNRKEKPAAVTKSRKRKKQDTETINNISDDNVEKKLTENDSTQHISDKNVIKKLAIKKESAKESKAKNAKKIKSDNIVKGKQTKQRAEAANNTNKDIHIPMNSSDIMSVLLHMEGPSTSQLGQGSSKVKDDSDAMMSDSDSGDNADEVAELESDDSEGDWEEVEDHHGNSPKKSQPPSQSVEITLEAPALYKKRKKKGFDLNAYLKKQVNKYKRELALDMHKVHLLCLISRGLYLNSLCHLDTLKAQVMSVVMASRELTFPVMKGHSQGHVSSVLKWMNREFVFSESKSIQEENMESKLARCIGNRMFNNTTEFALVCIMVLRYLGFMARLVMSLQPVPFKQAQKSGSQRNNKAKKSTQNKSKPTKAAKSMETKANVSSKSKKKTLKSETSSNSKKNRKKSLSSDIKSTNENTDNTQTVKRGKRRCSKNLTKGAYKEDNDDTGKDLDDDVEFMETDGSDTDADERDKGKKGKKKGKSGKSSQNTLVNKGDEEASSDSDFEQDSIIMRTQSLRKEPSKKGNRKVLSSDSDVASSDRNNIYIGNDIWIEVFIEGENKWISVCSKCKEIAKPADIRSHATFPLYYVVGLDNCSAVKDVTVRYASEWLTKTRKLRIEDDWWKETLAPFLPSDRERDMAEDKDMQTYLLQCPLPSSIPQFKGHPLYILKRHLLKYEALYPNSIVPVGYIKGEPVYSRDCCHILHTRENWLKEGRSVRLREEPYKIVKSMKRRNDRDTEPKDCELFGKWQTEIYIPPPAVDGVVPRNAHGNVEMFQPWMLPAGTVHLKGLPGLNRIARKLDLDCAPAMVGWDHHCGFAHPVMDGWIVCEEHKDIFLAAWDEEQEIIQEREKEKREKRVYGNWKKLIRGLLIKERLKKRYEEKPAHVSTEHKQELLIDPDEIASDVQHSWPRNRQTVSNKAIGVVEKL